MFNLKNTNFFLVVFYQKESSTSQQKYVTAALVHSAKYVHK